MYQTDNNIKFILSAYYAVLFISFYKKDWRISRPEISSTLKLIEASQRKGLNINEDKTNYMIMTRRIINKQNINIDQYTYE